MTLSNAVHFSPTSDADYAYIVMGDSPDFQKARKGDFRVVQETTTTSSLHHVVPRWCERLEHSVLSVR